MRIWNVSDATVSYGIRVGAVCERLKKDHEILSLEIAPGDPLIASTVDLVVFQRPLNPYHLYAFKEMGARVVGDVDDDFSALPQGHPGYSSLGPGNKPILDGHKECLRIADTLIVSTDVLAERFQEYNNNIVVIPNAWNDSLDSWKKIRERPHHRKNIFTIGWGGTITHRADFSLIVEPLIKFAANFDVKIKIAGDPEIYKMLRPIPEHKKYFYPFMPGSVWPIFLSSLDLFLVPLKDDHFNEAKSDIKLVDSGAARTPFIASSVRSYNSWKGGGAIVDSPEAWYETMQEILTNQDIWSTLSNDGDIVSQERSLTNLLPMWLEALEIK